jgi:arylsulfatase A-like enzyme
MPACSDSRDRPNILLVTLDTTRADRLGCYGYDKPLTPRIDQVAREGVLFELAIAQAAVTPVSHASILTGLYPFQHGLRVLYGASNYRLEEGRHAALAEILKQEGWRTAAFVSSFPVSEYFGLHHGFDVFETGLSGDLEKKMFINDEGKAQWAVDRNQRRADVTTDQALSWLRETKGPFFMWLHFFDPHDASLTPAPRFVQPYLKGRRKQIDLARALYDAEVAFMDLQLGRLFDLLKEQGLYENTIVVITNDHGEGLGDHDWWAHRILYQEQIRMPLIVRLPGGPAGKVVPDLVRGIDIMPTILECIGVACPPVEGRSLMGFIRGEPEPERVAYSDALIRLDDNRPDHAIGIYNDLMYCVMTRSWKLIHRHFQPEASELYRIDIDPGEERNVIEDFPEKREELFGFLETPGIMIEKLIPRAEEDEAARRLRELGY